MTEEELALEILYRSKAKRILKRREEGKKRKPSNFKYSSFREVLRINTVSADIVRQLGVTNAYYKNRIVGKVTQFTPQELAKIADIIDVDYKHVAELYLQKVKENRYKYLYPTDPTISDIVEEVYGIE